LKGLRIHRSTADLMYDAMIYLLLAIIIFAFIYPLYYMFVISVSGGPQVMRGEVTWFPLAFTLEAYHKVFGLPDFLRSYGNTVLYTSLGTLINLILTSLCAYPLSRKKLFGRKWITVMIIITLLFHGGLIPTYLVINSLGMMNTIWAMVIPPAINVWYMIIMRTFFQNIPEEIHESAHLDGANELYIFLRIVLPLSMPVMATMIMFYAVWHWNSFFPALLYLNDSELYPVQLIMRGVIIEGGIADQTNASDRLAVIQTSIRYAVIIVTILPILAVYPFIQKYFVKGAMIGSLKG
jgi:putative aldouronate transport system permease protein